MGWFAVKTVWFKELLDTVRDKRTLYMMVLLPIVLMPLTMMVGPLLMQQQQQALTESSPVITVVGDETAAALARWITDNGSLQATHMPSMERAMAEEELLEERTELVVYVQHGQQLSDNVPIAVDLLYESRRGSSANAMWRFESQLEQFSAEIVAQRLDALHVSQTILHPFTVTSVHDLTTTDQIGGQLLAMILPFLIALWAVMGGMYTAIDVGAGEKERGTLESLVMAPVSRFALVFGKLLAIITVTLTAVVLLVLSMVGSIVYLLPRLMAADGASFGFAIAPGTVVLILFVMVLFVGMNAALLLALSAFGKSFREGQAYITGLMLLVMLPGMYFMFLEHIAATTWTYIVPVFNVMVTLRELLEGTVNWSHLGLTLASLAVYAGVATFISFRIFLHERVLFRS